MKRNAAAARLHAMVTTHHGYDDTCQCRYGRKIDETLAMERSAGAAMLDVEVLATILVDAENDDQMGVEYQPHRLAEYIAARLLDAAPSPSAETEGEWYFPERIPTDGEDR